MADSPVSPAPVPVRLARWTPQPLPAASSVDYKGKLIVGRYLMMRKIGGGGMSTIHEARDINLGIRCVVKILRDDLPADPVDRFRREAVVLATLQHEHIARIFDRHDLADGPRFLVTEYIDGVNLGLLRRRGPVPAAVVHQIGLQVSSALCYAHAAGVIHRDINPANIMLVRHAGGDVFAKVIDFGIAQLVRGSELADPDHAPPGARRQTRGDIVLGTAPYYRGHEGPQRDVYALALTLAELLTGQPPDHDVDLASKRIPPALARVIESALRCDALPTMDAFHTALREADVQPPDEAEAIRRQYVTRVDPPSTTPPPTASQTAELERFAGRYIVRGELGHGGMGLVRLAFDCQARRQVALKTIHPRCAGMQNLEHRFRREARALAAIEHPGPPALFEMGATPEPYFTMEIVDGITLAATLKHGKIEPRRALTFAIELADILKAAHDVGVVHRDVKPENIIVGHNDRLRLLDFGACMLLPRFHQRHLLFPATPPAERYETGELETVGTPGYTAPEILHLTGGTSPRSDVYSVCAVLYEMLTGRPLTNRGTGRAPAVERREFPAALGPVADLLRQGTALEPSARPWTIVELSRSFEILRADLERARERRTIVPVVVCVAAVTLLLTTLAVLALTPITPITPSPEAHPIAASIATVTPPTTPEPARTAELPVAAPFTSPPSPSHAPTHAAPAPATEPAPEPPTSEPQAATTRKPPPAPAPLTRASVAKRVAQRHDALREKCGAPFLSITLEIAGGRSTLAAVDGMQFSDSNSLHTCVRDQLAGLRFPGSAAPATFTLTLNLKALP
ncbi:MAG: serine/threonine protein kinase [Myxococcales bacterium]|nr:serine/threonine protein kinase [Myxococcales bacterium]